MTGAGTLLAQILPIFAVIAVGAVAGRWERFGERAAAMLNDLVYYLALPALIFSSVAGADLSAGLPFSAVAGSVLAVLVAYGLGAVLALTVFGRPGREANAVGLVAGWGNVGYLGIPLTVSVLGPATAFAASVTSTIHTALAITVFLVVATVASRRPSAGSDEAVATGRPGALGLVTLLGRRVLGNPVVIGIALGAAFALLRIPLPGPVSETVDLVAAMAAPGGLFALGILLRGAVSTVRASTSALLEIAACVVVKIVVMPLLAAGAVHLLGIPAPWAAVLIVMSALPDAATVFVLTAQYRTWHRESTAVVVVTTVLSLVSLPVVLVTLL